MLSERRCDESTRTECHNEPRGVTKRGKRESARKKMLRFHHGRFQQESLEKVVREWRSHFQRIKIDYVAARTIRTIKRTSGEESENQDAATANRTNPTPSACVFKIISDHFPERSCTQPRKSNSESTVGLLDFANRIGRITDLSILSCSANRLTGTWGKRTRCDI